MRRLLEEFRAPRRWEGGVVKAEIRDGVVRFLDWNGKAWEPIDLDTADFLPARLASPELLARAGVPGDDPSLMPGGEAAPES